MELMRNCVALGVAGTALLSGEQPPLVRGRFNSSIMGSFIRTFAKESLTL